MADAQGTIIAIYGMEPNREDEYPVEFRVGQRFDARRAEVTAIRYREANRGDHAVGWFDVFTEGGRAVSMNERAVAEIVYDYD